MHSHICLQLHLSSSKNRSNKGLPFVLFCFVLFFFFPKALLQNDLWYFDVKDGWIKDEEASGVIPGRSGHSALFQNNELLVYGGILFGHFSVFESLLILDRIRWSCLGQLHLDIF